MRKTYAIDIDDVLAEYHQEFIVFCNENYGTSFRMEDFNHPELNKPWGIPHEEIMQRADSFLVAGRQALIPPRHGAQEMVRRLAQQHSLHVVTNRPVETSYHTMEWLDRHFPKAFADVHFCSKDNGNKLFRCKSAVCKTIGAGILLEDNLSNAGKCAAEGIHVYLFDQPWNRHEIPLFPGAVVRISTWQDKLLETLLG